MELLIDLVPPALGCWGSAPLLGVAQTGQYNDLEGATWRAIMVEDDG